MMELEHFFQYGSCVSWSNFILWSCRALFGYACAIGIYRLYLAPAARFPGPRLAALTFLYEGYYDAWRGGQYTWKIRELHEKYGPFVRINPCEIHCNDPKFFDVLYVSSARRRTNKWFWFIRGSWTRNSMFKTMDHNLHKQRRNQMSTFFSKTSIRTLEPLVSSKIDMLCARLEQAAGSGSTVNLTYAFVALTLDVVSRICLGFSYDSLARDDFAREWYELVVRTGMSSYLSRQSPMLYYLVSWFPVLAGSTYMKGTMEAIEQRRKDLQESIRTVVERHARGEKPPAHEGFTIIHEMLDADVPAEEKSFSRLVEEAHSLLGAGSMTTATVLETTVYHLLSNPSYLQRLLEELRRVMPDGDSAAEGGAMPTVAELERLPFLTAVIHEGLRLGKSVSHRLARVSPDVDYAYHDVVIPRGVPVGMTALLMLEDPTIFPNPHSFDPDRWLPADSAEVRCRRKALVVFGGGTRMCLGLNLAWTELYLTLAILVRRLGTRMELHNVDFQRDIEITVDGFNALPSSESRGLRIVIS